MDPTTIMQVHMLQDALRKLVGPIDRLERAIAEPRLKVHRGILGSARSKIEEAGRLLSELQEFIEHTEK